MRSSIVAPLAPLLALAACAGAPPERVPTPAKTTAPAASVAPPPSPCDEVGALLASAKAAFDEGRLLRARRWLPQASARCPARAGEALALDLRASLSLNDIDSIAHLKSVASGAPDTPALKEALASQAPYDGDVPAGIPPSENSEDYYRAARAFVEGKLDEAGRGAMSVVLSGPGPLLQEAFVLAARVAEAAGDVPRANRMFARAFHAACVSGCDTLVRPPRADLFSLATMYPGLRLAARSCVGAGLRFETLTPDGKFHITSTDPGAEIRAVPDRILVRRIQFEGPDLPPMACFSDKALFYLVHQHNQRDRVFVGPLGGELRAVMGPHLWISDLFQLPLVTASGTIYVPNTLNFSGKREWYHAGPRDRALKRFPVARDWFEPALLSNGDLVGVEEHSARPSGGRSLAIYSGTTGKRLRPLGLVRDGVRLVVSPDEQRLVYDLWGEALGVVNLSNEGLERERDVGAPSPPGWTPRFRTVEVEKMDSLQAVVDSSRVIIRDDDRRFAVADLVKGSSETASITAGPLGRTGVSAGRIVVKSGDSLLALRMSDGHVSRDEPGVAFAPPPPPTSRPPGWDRERPRPPCILPGTVGHSGAVLSICGKGVWRDHPHTQAPAELLGELPLTVLNARHLEWDEGSGLFFMTGEDEVLIGQPVNKRIETLRVRFTNAGTGGIAIDNKWYFEFFGEVPAAFRRSAVCADSLPIEACTDLYESPGLVRRFLAQDFSYRGP